MTLPFANCVLGKWVFAFGLFSVQQLCWFLGGIKLCIFLSGLWRKPPALSLISQQQSWGYFVTLGLFSYWGSPPAVLFLCCCVLLWRLCQVRCACCSFSFQVSSSGLVCSCWEERSWRPSPVPLYLWKGFSECSARQAKQVWSVGVQQQTIQKSKYSLP